jgi:hypothetical protein
MSTEENPNLEQLAEILVLSPGLTDQSLLTYSRLWQLETWLRNMVYAEYFSKYGTEWDTNLKAQGSTTAYTNDKQLSHMPTAEESKISFVTFSGLLKAISTEWDLFANYLPPQEIWDAKIKEVSQVRNRIAHFRSSHRDDLKRTEQLLRDVDKGIWRFCTSFRPNSPTISPSNDCVDPVIYEFSNLIPYLSGTTRHRNPTSYSSRLQQKLDISFEVVQRDWSHAPTDNGIAGNPGFFYSLHLQGIHGWKIGVENVLEATKGIHSLLTYIFLEAIGGIRVIVSSVSTVEKLIKLFSAIIACVADALLPDSPSEHREEFSVYFEKQIEYLQGIADKYSENILGPRHPMTFLTRSEPCSIFSA